MNDLNAHNEHDLTRMVNAHGWRVILPDGQSIQIQDVCVLRSGGVKSMAGLRPRPAHMIRFGDQMWYHLTSTSAGEGAVIGEMRYSRAMRHPDLATEATWGMPPSVTHCAVVSSGHKGLAGGFGGALPIGTAGIGWSPSKALIPANSKLGVAR